MTVSRNIDWRDYFNLPTWIQWVAGLIISADRSDTVLGLHFREELVVLKKKRKKRKKKRNSMSFNNSYILGLALNSSKCKSSQ